MSEQKDIVVEMQEHKDQYSAYGWDMAQPDISIVKLTEWIA